MFQVYVMSLKITRFGSTIPMFKLVTIIYFTVSADLQRNA